MSQAVTTTRTRFSRRAVLATTIALLALVFAWQIVVAFQRNTDPVPLAATQQSEDNARLGDRPAPVVVIDQPASTYEEVSADGSANTVSANPQTTEPRPAELPEAPGTAQYDRYGNVIMVDGEQWTGHVFDFRPIRPVRTQLMRTTAYSPDERSCGKWADGYTASGRSVWMNGGRLVAADPAIPYGTIMTIPGYNYGRPVQVWDRGGAIRGNRLDVLYPTHEIAMQWGVQDLDVVIWEFVETD